MRKNKVFVIILTILALVFVGIFQFCPDTRVSYASIVNLPLEEVFNLKNQVVLSAQNRDLAFLRGVNYNSDNPAKIKFFFDLKAQSKLSLKDRERMLRYFFAFLAMPDDKLWVNLSPYEKDRILPQELSKLDIGKDMLIEDYLLKQLTSALTDPKTTHGRNFWQKVEKIAFSIAKTKNVPIETFYKVWVVPEKMEVAKYKDSLFVKQAKLKVMLESDYFTAQNNQGLQMQNSRSQIQNKINNEAKEIFKRELLPIIEEQVNKSVTFAPLRQLFYAYILAKAFKQSVQKGEITNYFNHNQASAIQLNINQLREKVFNAYVNSMREGAYSAVSKLNQQKRKYFSGGVVCKGEPMVKDVGSADVKEMFEGSRGVGQIYSSLGYRSRLNPEGLRAVIHQLNEAVSSLSNFPRPEWSKIVSQLESSFSLNSKLLGPSVQRNLSELLESLINRSPQVDQSVIDFINLLQKEFVDFANSYGNASVALEAESFFAKFLDQAEQRSPETNSFVIDGRQVVVRDNIIDILVFKHESKFFDKLGQIAGALDEQSVTKDVNLYDLCVDAQEAKEVSADLAEQFKQALMNVLRGYNPQDRLGQMNFMRNLLEPAQSLGLLDVRDIPSSVGFHSLQVDVLKSLWGHLKDREKLNQCRMNLGLLEEAFRIFERFNPKLRDEYLRLLYRMQENLAKGVVLGDNVLSALNEKLLRPMASDPTLDGSLLDRGQLQQALNNLRDGMVGIVSLVEGQDSVVRLDNHLLPYLNKFEVQRQEVASKQTLEYTVVEYAQARQDLAKRMASSILDKLDSLTLNLEELRRKDLAKNLESLEDSYLDISLNSAMLTESTLRKSYRVLAEVADNLINAYNRRELSESDLLRAMGELEMLGVIEKKSQIHDTSAKSEVNKSEGLRYIDVINYLRSLAFTVSNRLKNPQDKKFLDDQFFSHKLDKLWKHYWNEWHEKYGMLEKDNPEFDRKYFQDLVKEGLKEAWHTVCQAYRDGNLSSDGYRVLREMFNSLNEYGFSFEGPELREKNVGGLHFSAQFAGLDLKENVDDFDNIKPLVDIEYTVNTQTTLSVKEFVQSL